MKRCDSFKSRILITVVRDGDLCFCRRSCKTKHFVNRLDASLEEASQRDSEALRTIRKASVEQASEDSGPHPVNVESRSETWIQILGVAGVFATAIAVAWLGNVTNIAFQMFMWWYIVPIGGLVTGAVAGASFWASCRSFEIRPGYQTFLTAGLAGVVGYLTIFVVKWWIAEFEGIQIRHEIGFFSWLSETLSTQTILTRRKSELIRVGNWGYVQFLVSMGSFVVGVIMPILSRASAPFCDRCQKYMRITGRQDRSSSDPVALGQALAPIIRAVQTGEIQQAIDLHSISGEAGMKEWMTTSIVVQSCPNCGGCEATLTATVPSDQGRVRLEGFEFRGKSSRRVTLEG